jgi:hypothetical protein
MRRTVKLDQNFSQMALNQMSISNSSIVRASKQICMPVIIADWTAATV